jgi:hypothetical protein
VIKTGLMPEARRRAGRFKEWNLMAKGFARHKRLQNLF